MKLTDGTYSVTNKRDVANLLRDIDARLGIAEARERQQAREAARVADSGKVAGLRSVGATRGASDKQGDVVL